MLYYTLSSSKKQAGYNFFLQNVPRNRFPPNRRMPFCEQWVFLVIRFERENRTRSTRYLNRGKLRSRTISCIARLSIQSIASILFPKKRHFVSGRSLTQCPSASSDLSEQMLRLLFSAALAKENPETAGNQSTAARSRMAGRSFSACSIFSGSTSK